MKSFIVKVQTPLFSSHSDAGALIYNEDRSVMEEFPLTEELLDIMEGEPKRFFNAHIDKNKKLNIDSPAEWQDW